MEDNERAEAREMWAELEMIELRQPQQVQQRVLLAQIEGDTATMHTQDFIRLLESAAQLEADNKRLYASIEAHRAWGEGRERLAKVLAVAHLITWGWLFVYGCYWLGRHI